MANNPIMWVDPSGCDSSYFFRGDDGYVKNAPVGLSMDQQGDADITNFYDHVNNKESNMISIYTSFSTKMSSTLKFTKENSVIRIKKEDLYSLQGENLKIYTADDVKAYYESINDEIKANNVYQNMVKNNEILVEGEIPAEYINKMPKDKVIKTKENNNTNKKRSKYFAKDC